MTHLIAIFLAILPFTVETRVLQCCSEGGRAVTSVVPEAIGVRTSRSSSARTHKSPLKPCRYHSAMRASQPLPYPLYAARLVLVLVAWACVWGTVAGAGQGPWEACEAPVCLEVRRQAEGLSRLKFLRNYIIQTVGMMNKLVTSLDQELVKTGEGLTQFIGTRCPAAHPILLQVTKTDDPDVPSISDEDNVITDSDEDNVITDSDDDQASHSSTAPSQRESHDGGAGSQYWQNTGLAHSDLQGSGGVSGKALTGQKGISSAIKTDKSSSSSSSSSSRVTSSSSSSVSSGQSTTNKFNPIGGQQPNRQSRKTTSTSQPGTYATSSASQPGTYAASSASQPGTYVASSSQEEESADGGAGQVNLGLGVGSGGGRGALRPGGANQGSWVYDWYNVGHSGASRGHGGASRGHGGANRGHGGASRGHGGANRGHGGANRGHGGDSSVEDQDNEGHHSWGSRDQSGSSWGHDGGRGRDIGIGGSRWHSCHSVARGSPHWVPGLDDWCVTSCAAGYCPPSHCVC